MQQNGSIQWFEHTDDMPGDFAVSDEADDSARYAHHGFPVVVAPAALLQSRTSFGKLPGSRKDEGEGAFGCGQRQRLVGRSDRNAGVKCIFIDDGCHRAGGMADKLQLPGFGQYFRCEQRRTPGSETGIEFANDGCQSFAGEGKACIG
ncbi:hypothetical protein D3C71_1546430 [compost metagenome]